MVSTGATGGRSIVWMVLMAIMALAALMAARAWAARSLTLQEIDQSWPSQHALQSHQGEIWNTAIAMTQIQTRTCDRMEGYWSQARQSYMILCRIQGELWGCVILRRAKDQSLVIVTAYAAHRSHWDKIILRDGYQPVAMGR